MQKKVTFRFRKLEDGSYRPYRVPTNLGQLLVPFIKNEADEIVCHEDVTAWGAPGECHSDVSKGADQAFIALDKELEEETGLNFGDLMDCVSRLGAYKWWFFNRVDRFYESPFFGGRNVHSC